MDDKEIIVFSVLPLRDIVAFPSVVGTFYVGRDKSLSAIDFAVNNSNNILMVSQKDQSIEQLSPKDLHEVGVIGNILQVSKLSDGNTKILVDITERVKISEFIDAGSYLLAKVEKFEYEDEELLDQGDLDDLEQQEPLRRLLNESFDRYLQVLQAGNSQSIATLAPEAMSIFKGLRNLESATDYLAYNLPIKAEEKQKLLEARFLKSKVVHMLSVLEREIEICNTKNQIKLDIAKQMDKRQKEYYLNEELKAINKQLGNDMDEFSDIKELEAKVAKMKITKDALDKVKNEIKKLKQTHPSSMEGSIIKNYLDFILSLPWGKYAKANIDIKSVEGNLNNNHYGIEKAKERVLEYLSVIKRSKSMDGPIICFYGPPGVGKTSLARSIAESMGLPFQKVALGGVKDETEIRGHRRTYIGSMCGRIISAIKKSGVQNPVILLDEIDKMGMDFRGDPASALLEVLDPEQNKTFVDHYLDVEYDLSKVFFIATANSTNIPKPLLDRMELIKLSGYTEEEKLDIAVKHLLPKVLKEHCIKEGEITINEQIIADIISHYTREAGVRNLEREISKIVRKCLKDIITDDSIKSVSIDDELLEKMLGVRKYTDTDIIRTNLVGVTHGLAYTEVGGDILNIEAVLSPGKGNIKVTGKLGDVMKESADAAVTYVKSKTDDLKIKPEYYKDFDLHIHVPEGAVPKDGPSAGIALCTTITSIMTGIPVKHDIAMTGEITLTGRVLPIGGLKEKLLAALRSNIKNVIIPEENVKDIKELPDIIKNELNIIPVSNAIDVLKHALESNPFNV